MVAAPTHLSFLRGSTSLMPLARDRFCFRRSRRVSCCFHSNIDKPPDISWLLAALQLSMCELNLGQSN